MIQELQFHKGPIYLGRHSQNHIVLPDAAVSRQHAVLYFTQDGQAILEDLHSANGTFLNGKAIDKVQVKPGDVMRIADYTIEIRPDTTVTSRASMEDTIVGAPRKIQVIGRRFAGDHGPEMIIPAARLRAFAEAAWLVCSSSGPDQTAAKVAAYVLNQFDAGLAWVGLRQGTTGPWTSQACLNQQGRSTTLQDREVIRLIELAVEKVDFILCPQGLEESRGRSLMVCPAVIPDGVVGCLVVQGQPGRRPYELRDLDYLILVAIHTAAVTINL
ncbi:MAG: FHA domain-containing protein [Sedimentisphaerales bacterium]|nr:FHA domain-containing protein [Sedimentisphaerales bacterium]